MGTDGTTGTERLTLAFSRVAIERLDDPAAAFEDAQRWSEHVGVVDNDLEAVDAAVERYGLRQDFDLGDRDVWLNMQGIRESTHTPRHVYVGASEEDRRVADHLGWEFVSVTEAAEKAGWELAGTGSGARTGDGEEAGVLTRVVRTVREQLRSL